MSELKFEEILVRGSARWEVAVDWSHGDADLTTSDKFTLKGSDDQAIIAWIAKFEECREAINNARWYSAPFNREEWQEKLGMELEYDSIYEGCDNPPSMSIASVVWFDGCGKRFNVTGY
jgi:hypothetical protein